MKRITESIPDKRRDFWSLVTSREIKGVLRKSEVTSPFRISKDLTVSSIELPNETPKDAKQDKKNTKHRSLSHQQPPASLHLWSSCRHRSNWSYSTSYRRTWQSRRLSQSPEQSSFHWMRNCWLGLSGQRSASAPSPFPRPKWTPVCLLRLSRIGTCLQF